MGSAKRNDLEMYEQYANEWWQQSSGRFRSLQGISIFRLLLLEAWVPTLEGKVVYDLGCGGGLLSAPLSQKGAIVTGIDRSAASIREAEKHSAASARYLQSDFREVPLPDGSADLILLADVLDHLPDYEKVLAEAKRLLRPSGRVFVNTINRNLLSKLLAVHLAENIGLVPKGTHDPNLFIRPTELASASKRVGLNVIAWQGERPDLGKTIRKWALHFAASRSLALAYSALLAPVKL